MLEQSRISRWKLLVAALYAVTMLTLGFAHSNVRPPASDATASELAAFVLPDGTPPTLCGGTTGDPVQKHGGKICDACQLTAAPGGLAAPPSFLDAPRLIARLAPVLSLASVAEPPLPAPQSRGPPVFLTAFV